MDDLERDVLARLAALGTTSDAASLDAAAVAVVALRRTYVHEDRPDWTGRSPAYRARLDQLQAEAGVRLGDDVVAGLRFAVGNALRATAPVEDLRVLGLVPGPPVDPIAVAADVRDRLRTLTVVPVRDEDQDLFAELLADITALSQRLGLPGH